MQIHAFRCFGVRPGSGNAALVVRGFDPDPLARQAFARERQMPACAFVDDGVIDYYYPHARSPLCLHATLAAAGLLGNTHLRTAMRGQELMLTADGGQAFVRLAAQDAPPVPPGMAALLAAEPVSAPAVASVGSPKLLVEVASPAILHGLQPALEAICAAGKATGVNGIYAWCRRPDGALEGRNFNHLDPALEDSATGVAAGALTVLLGQGIELHQGTLQGQPCLIRTRRDGGAVLVGGAVEPSTLTPG